MQSSWIFFSLLLVFAFCAYQRFALWQHAAALAAILVVFTFFTDVGKLATGLFWLAYLVLFVPLSIPSLRLPLSQRVLGYFRRALPKLSKTEREALASGNPWWDAELFSGRPDWRRLSDLPMPNLNDEERAFLEGPVEELCRMIDDWEVTHHRLDLPAEAWEFLKKHRFFGMIIPKAYGGLGFSVQARSAVIAKLASRSITAAVTAMVPNSLGPAELLLRYGSQQQKDYYLPRLAKGEEIPCFALTSPHAGSDAASMIDRGVACRGEFDGKKDVLGIRLNWEKRYITLAPVATVLGLAFKLEDPEHLLGENVDCGITLALVPVHLPGVEIGKRHFPLNQAFLNGPTRGRDVFIPIDFIIGGRDNAGHGWRMLMECLAEGRGVSLPALSSGAGQMALRATSGYARIRRQFKRPIGHFEGVQEVIARIAGCAYAIDALRTVTAAALDQGERSAVIAAICKYHCTEKMRVLINDAMDLFGGTGICLGPRNLLGRAYEAVPISITVEGANILTRNLMIYGQGAIRCHPYVLKEIEAASMKRAEDALKAFDRAFFGHLAFFLSNLVRTPLLACTDLSPSKRLDTRMKRRIARMSAALALISDIAMFMLGGSLKQRENLSARLGDVLSELYIASCTLKLNQQEGGAHAQLAEWVCLDALYQGQAALKAFLDNFPSRTIALFLHAITFPFGLRYRPPEDALGRAIAKRLLEDSKFRASLTSNVFLQLNPNDPLGRIEMAYEKAIAGANAWKKLQEWAKTHAREQDDITSLIEAAIEDGTLTKHEGRLLIDAEKAMLDAVAVDEFSTEQLRYCPEWETQGRGNG